MLLKCPRCAGDLQIELKAGDRATCPTCSARLRLRRDTASPESGGFISDSNASSAFSATREVGDIDSARQSRDVPLPSGTRLSGFELQTVVGRGGMATVYKGVQLSLNRPVAIKILASRFASNPNFIQRFEREAGALANLNHPNIVNIIDKGTVDNHYFFVMELVQGITLDQLLHSVELNERHYTHIINEIKKALTYVHDRGIVHRDIKPSNILVNKQGAVKVSDFGIAHITDAMHAQERFGKNATVGTANYIAPEQARDPGAVDVRADVYSLGVTFYKMFTKQLPVGDYKPASLINAKLPRLVDPVLAKAMHPDPNERYQSAREFCDALLGLFVPAGQSVETPAETDSQPFLFNPSLFGVGQSGSAQVRDESSISLFVPASWPGGADSVPVTPTPGRNPVVDTRDSKAAKLHNQLASRRRNFWFLSFCTLIIFILSLGVGYYLWLTLFRF